MKILITTDLYTTVENGVVTSVNNLTKGLIALGAEVKILTLSEDLHSYVRGNVTYLSSINADKIYPNARVSPLARKKLLWQLADWKPDVIHSQCEFSTFPFALFIAHRAGCPIVHTYHTVYEDYTHYLFSSEKIGKNAMQLFTKEFSKRVDLLVAPTEKVSDLLIRYGCRTPIRIMPTGLDLEKLVAPKDEDCRSKLRQSLGIPKENKVLLYTGRLAKEKKLEEIIEYLGRIRPQKTTFLIVGGGPDKENIEKKLAECKIDFAVMTGMVKPEDMKFYYSIGDVFTSASQSETQGLTYIEALANGLPLLCRRDKCLDGVLINGKTGYAYETEEEYAKYLETLLTEDLSEMSKNAAKLAADKYSLETFAKTAMGIYKECKNNFSAEEKTSKHVKLSIQGHKTSSFLENKIKKTVQKLKMLI